MARRTKSRDHRDRSAREPRRATAPKPARTVVPTTATGTTSATIATTDACGRRADAAAIAARKPSTKGPTIPTGERAPLPGTTRGHIRGPPAAGAAGTRPRQARTFFVMMPRSEQPRIGFNAAGRDRRPEVKTTIGPRPKRPPPTITNRRTRGKRRRRVRSLLRRPRPTKIRPFA